MIIAVACVVIIGGFVAGYFWAPVAAGVSCPTLKNGVTDLLGCANARVPLGSMQCVPLAGAPLADDIAHQLNPDHPSWYPPLAQTECAK